MPQHGARNANSGIANDLMAAKWILHAAAPAPCRYCLGAALAMAEMKVYLATLARSYDFTVDNNTEWVQAVGKVPKNGLPIVISRRE